MRAYMAWHGPDAELGAVLVFANSAREARKLAYPVIQGWWSDAQWVHIRTKWLSSEETQWLHRLHSSGAASEVIESPPTCSRCELWGAELVDGICKNCLGDDEG